MKQFLLDITNTDEFTEMPCEAQALYFHLALNADCDGRIYNTNSIIRATCNTGESLSKLLDMGFVTGGEYGFYRIDSFNKQTGTNRKSTEKENTDYTFSLKEASSVAKRIYNSHFGLYGDGCFDVNSDDFARILVAATNPTDSKSPLDIYNELKL
jgi:hypothetical protein